ncbi:PREDICTED: uncharacterized protein LOC105449736 [Wasmannia auropunctata]|uniref:uncharacterized protein LOC105449736 n=1 Tax=Wasmannia auropunctata TaxID=64793 RepID=UPI0005F0C02B|nr:PREDICTED: uncharacterized protein LOC105449736 [Wasmannia auropunctata]
MSSDGHGNYDFVVVEFISRGRPGQRQIDLVPSKWIEYDEKKARLMVKFMPPPYEKEDFQLITELAKKLADAPEDWILYSIKVRAQAKTYADGCKKLKKLEEQLYAFTDSAADPVTVAATIEESLKVQTLKKKVDDLKEMMTVPQIIDRSKISQTATKKKRLPIVQATPARAPQTATFARANGNCLNNPPGGLFSRKRKTVHRGISKPEFCDERQIWIALGTPRNESAATSTLTRHQVFLRKLQKSRQAAAEYSIIARHRRRLRHSSTEEDGPKKDCRNETAKGQAASRNCQESLLTGLDPSIYD